MLQHFKTLKFHFEKTAEAKFILSLSTYTKALYLYIVKVNVYTQTNIVQKSFVCDKNIKLLSLEIFS